MGLNLADHKAEAVLISNRRKRYSARNKIGDYTVEPHRDIRYFGALIDGRLSFERHRYGQNLRESDDSANGIIAHYAKY